MKKILVGAAVLVLALTACGGKAERNAGDNLPVKTVSEQYKIVDAGGRDVFVYCDPTGFRLWRMEYSNEFTALPDETCKRTS